MEIIGHKFDRRRSDVLFGAMQLGRAWNGTIQGFCAAAKRVRSAQVSPLAGVGPHQRRRVRLSVETALCLVLTQGEIALNYYGAKELAESFRTVRKNTITIAQEIPEEKYSFQPAPNTRTVGELLAHISLAYNFQYQVHGQEHRSSLEGFDFPSLMQRLVAEEKVQRSKDQTIEVLHSSGEKWAGWLEGLTESFLGERVEMAAGMTPSAGAVSK